MPIEDLELTILMPCLNEAETLQICIEKAKSYLLASGMHGEVLIADNGSTDGSQRIARDSGARVVDVPKRGYGSALIAGINAANGKYIIMGDADDSYDFTNLSLYVEALRKGNDLVMGNRFKGGIERGAMPWLHKYLGNPVLSFIGRLFFKTTIGDFHCGLRGFRKESIIKLNLKSSGMEFASEVVVSSVLNNFLIDEVPTTLKKDGRSRPPHLRTWRDGWRHLRFLLLYSPRWLFLYPGLTLLIVSSVTFIVTYILKISVFGVELGINTLISSMAGVVSGIQLIYFSVFTKKLGEQNGFLPKSIPTRNSTLTNLFTLERTIVLSSSMIATGLFLFLSALHFWQNANFGQINLQRELQNVIPSVLLIIVGIQTAFSSLFLAILEI